jgi:hypothetical protein
VITVVQDDGDVNVRRFDDEGVLRSQTFEDGSDTRDWHIRHRSFDDAGEIVSQVFWEDAPFLG